MVCQRYIEKLYNILLHKVLLESALPSRLSNGTFRKSMGSMDSKEVVVGYRNREYFQLLSLAWAC